MDVKTELGQKEPIYASRTPNLAAVSENGSEPMSGSKNVSGAHPMYTNQDLLGWEEENVEIIPNGAVARRIFTIYMGYGDY